MTDQKNKQHPRPSGLLGPVLLPGHTVKQHNDKVREWVREGNRKNKELEEKFRREREHSGEHTGE